MNEEKNIPEEQPATGNEQLANENISQEQTIEQLQTTNSKLQTKEMEVHHHPDLHHRKKHWKEYFLEFLMIFLAVTLGFFAESYREYLRDKDNAQQLMVSLVQDLKKDTAMLAFSIYASDSTLRTVSRLYDSLQQPANKINFKKIEDAILDCDNWMYFIPNDGTITQLKNAGYLRLLNSTKVSGWINYYEWWLTAVKGSELKNDSYAEKYIIGFMEQHFTPANLHSMFVDTSNAYNSELRNITAKDIANFSADIMMYYSKASLMIERYKDCKASATNFMQYIQKEFKIQ